MLLLYRNWYTRHFLSSSIYIPLCFYFIHRSRDCCICFIPIYIPRCCYNIETWSICSIHRWPIYIPLCFYFIPRAIQHWYSLAWYLHSTMLLLYRSRRQSGGAVGRDIYIPLCFYFIDCFRRFLRLFQFLFTFHYASTLSIRGHCIDGVGQDLHSTMLLLYRVWRRCPYRKEWNLHSTMLLLYREHLWWEFWSIFIYIPLCFYFIMLPKSPSNR